MSDTQQFNFDRVVDRHSSWCTRWDFVADRFGHDDLLPLTISDMDIPMAPAVIDELQRRVAQGVTGACGSIKRCRRICGRVPDINKCRRPLLPRNPGGGRTYRRLPARRGWMRANLQLVAQRLNAAFPALHWQPPQATYLAWINLYPLGIDDGELQRELIEQHKVAIKPDSTCGESALSRPLLRR